MKVLVTEELREITKRAREKDFPYVLSPEQVAFLDRSGYHIVDAAEFRPKKVRCVVGLKYAGAGWTVSAIIDIPEDFYLKLKDYESTEAAMRAKRRRRGRR